MQEVLGRGAQKPKGALLDRSTGVKWVVPESGRLRCTVLEEQAAPSCDDLASDAGIAALLREIDEAPNDAECQKLYDLAMEVTPMFTAPQAIRVVQTVPKRVGLGKVEVIEGLMGCFTETADARTMLSLTTTLHEQLKLRARTQPCPLSNNGELDASSWKISTGNATGHYTFNLSYEPQRELARALARFAIAERAAGEGDEGTDGEASLPDTSQHGDRLNFRNARLDNSPFVLTQDWFSEESMPERGVLELDYVTTTRPKRSAKPMTTQSFKNMLVELGLHARVQETQRRLWTRTVTSTVEALRYSISRLSHQAQNPAIEQKAMPTAIRRTNMFMNDSKLNVGRIALKFKAQERAKRKRRAQEKDFRKMFGAMALETEGHMNRSELRSAFEKIGIFSLAERELECVIMYFDREHHGLVPMEDFLEFVEGSVVGDALDKLREHFKRLIEKQKAEAKAKKDEVQVVQSRRGSTAIRRKNIVPLGSGASGAQKGFASQEQSFRNAGQQRSKRGLRTVQGTRSAFEIDLRSFDNGRGAIDKADFPLMLKKFNVQLTGSECAGIYNEFDFEKTGSVSIHALLLFARGHHARAVKKFRKELERLLDDDVEGEAGHDAGGGPAQRSLSPERLRARFDPIFKRYDLDGSRTLDKQEFRLALEDIGVRLTAIELCGVVDALDENKDCEVSLQELIDWILGPEDSGIWRRSKSGSKSDNEYDTEIESDDQDEMKEKAEEEDEGEDKAADDASKPDSTPPVPYRKRRNGVVKKIVAMTDEGLEIPSVGEALANVGEKQAIAHYKAMNRTSYTQCHDEKQQGSLFEMLEKMAAGRAVARGEQSTEGGMTDMQRAQAQLRLGGYIDKSLRRRRAGVMYAQTSEEAKGAADDLLPVGYRELLCKVVEIETFVGLNRYVSVDQLARLWHAFPEDAGLRVELATRLFPRVLDAENWHRLLDQLGDDERLELLHRLGALNVLSTGFPDRWYRLELEERDQRELCRVLIALKRAESAPAAPPIIDENGEEQPAPGPKRGDTWKHPYYRASELEAWTDEDWTLPEEWFDAADDGAAPARVAANDGNGGGSDDRPPQSGGLPAKGVLALRYDSLSPGCTPDSAARAELGRRMLCGYRSSIFSRARIGPDGVPLDR